MIDVDAIVERARRYTAGLKTGGSAGQRTYGGPLPSAESPLERPEHRWPSERHLKPTRCHRCGSRTLETDPPYGLCKYGETRCLMCSRVVVRWKADNTERAPLTGEDARPKRGRPASLHAPECPCSSCRTKRWRERQDAAEVSS